MIRNLQQLDLNLLLIFDALMQEQNLSRAAARLHMSQPAASNALARLRKQLDAPLFQRTASGMVPTAQAQALHRPVHQALQLLQLGLQPKDSFDLHGEHLFRISMNDYAQARLLPSLLAGVTAKAPGVVISTQRDDVETLPKRLATGELDLAVDYIHFDDPELRYHPLIEEELVVIGRKGHAAFEGGLTVEDYQHNDHVSLLTRGGRGSPLEIVLGSARVRRQIKLYVPHFLVIPEVVASTNLLATIPRLQAEKAATNYPIQVAPMPIEMPAVQVSLIWHRQKDQDPGLHWLMEEIAAIDAS